MRPLRHTRLIAAAVSAFLLSAAGCTTTEKHTFVVSADGSVRELTTTETIGASGGKLEVTNEDDPAFGTELEIPPDALDRSTEITVSAEADVQGTPFGTRSVGPAIVITADPTVDQLNKLAQLTLPYKLDAKQGEQLVVLRKTGGNGLGTRATGGSVGDGVWEILLPRGTGDQTRRVVVDTDRFGIFVVSTAPEGLTLPDGGPNDGGNVIPLPDAVVPDGGGDGGGTGNDQRPPVFAGLRTAQVVDDDQGERFAELTWEAADDDVSSPGQIRYRLYLPSFATVGTPQGQSEPGALTLRVRVARGVTYYFLIRAVDAAGNEDSNLRILSVTVPTGAVGALLGAACQKGAECQSNSCVDGVCCETDCTGSCNYCANQGSEGLCEAAATGTDPRGACGTQGPGTQLLCGQDQTCSLCAVGTEICNNGVDDDGDGMTDVQDPACSACIGDLVCVTEPARIATPRNLNYSQHVTSVAANGAGELAAGVEDDSAPVQDGGPAAFFARSSEIDGFLGETEVQGSEVFSPRPVPVVVRGGAEWAIFYRRFDSGATQDVIVGVRVSDAGELVGTPTTVVSANSGTLGEFAAVATGDGYRIAYVSSAAQNQTLVVARVNAQLASSGAEVTVQPGSNFRFFGTPRMVDDRGAREVVVTAPTYTKGPTTLVASRLGYTAATPRVQLTLDIPETTVEEADVAVVGTSTTAANPVLIAYTYRGGQGDSSIATQRFDAALQPVGTAGAGSFGFISIGTLRLAAHPGQDAILLWTETFKSQYSNTWLTRVNATSAAIVSSIRLSDVSFELGRSEGIGGIVASGPNYGFAFNLTSELSGVATATACDPQTIPGNDQCAGAFPLAIGEYHLGNTSAAADDGALGTCTGAGRDVYYTLTVQGSAQINLVGTSDSIVALDVADSCTPTACDSSDSPTFGQTTSSASYFVSAGTYVIRVRVTRTGGVGGDYILSVNTPS